MSSADRSTRRSTDRCGSSVRVATSRVTHVLLTAILSVHPLPLAMSWRDNDYYRYFVQQPPITRTYLAGIVAVSLPPLFYLVSPITFINLWDYTIRGEIWRPLTAFLYGGGGLPLLFGVFFAYQYSLKLETEKFGDSKADYAFYLLFSMIDLMVSQDTLARALSDQFRDGISVKEYVCSILAGACLF